MYLSDKFKNKESKQYLNLKKILTISKTNGKFIK